MQKPARATTRHSNNKTNPGIFFFMLLPVLFSASSGFDVYEFMIGFPSFHLPSQPPYIRDDPFSRVLLNLLGHRGGACAGHEREHDERGEDGVSEDGHEDDDQHDVQD